MESKAQWVADLMKADGVSPDSVTPELALAYFDDVGRRIEKIQSICLTRPRAAEVVAALILKA